MALQIANLEVLEALLSIPTHPKLVSVVLDFATCYNHATFTCGFEKRKAPSLHSVIPLRAVDMRSRHHERPWLVAQDMNNRWVYDPERPDKKVCLFHSVCPKCGRNHMFDYREDCLTCGAVIKYNWHFHLQAHPNTVRVRECRAE